MRSFITAAALLQTLGHFASAQISNVSSSDCPAKGAVHLIVARASLEPMGFGIIGAVKDNILSRVPGSTAEFVVYPATLDQYTTSESDGVVAARALINAYINNCPGQPLVVMGYSQGAQVTADSLAGQQVRNFPVNATIQDPLAESTLARVAAAITMGDPSLIANSSYHVGTSTNNGLFPRQNNQNFNTNNLVSRIKAYCDAGDPYCAAPGNMLAVHLAYVGEYGAAAADFVIEQLTKWYTANGGSIVPLNSASSAVATATSTRSKTAASGTAIASKSAPSASATPSSTPAGPSNTASSASSTPTSTGAASSLQVTGAGMGALVAALFALM